MLDVICLTINHFSCIESTFIYYLFVHIKRASKKCVLIELKSIVLIKQLWVKVNVKITTILHYSLIAQIN